MFCFFYAYVTKILLPKLSQKKEHLTFNIFTFPKLQDNFEQNASNKGNVKMLEAFWCSTASDLADGEKQGKTFSYTPAQLLGPASGPLSL